MIRFKNLVSLLLALAMCLALTACSSGGSTPAATSAPAETAAPEYVYVSAFKPLSERSKNYVSVRSYSDDGLYYSSWEKVGENIPEGAKPQYEGQYDIYATFLYYMDKDGKVTKLENYKTMDAPVNENDYKEYVSGSDLSGICFTPDGFVTMETTYASWSDGDGNYPMYSEDYFMHQKFRQQYYIRSFDRQGHELTTAPIQVPEDGWLEAYRMVLDDNDNELFISRLAAGLDTMTECDPDTDELVDVPARSDRQPAVLEREGVRQRQI